MLGESPVACNRGRTFRITRRYLVLSAAIALLVVVAAPDGSAVQPWPAKPPSVSNPYDYHLYLFSATNPSDFSSTNYRQSGSQSGISALDNSPQQLSGVIGPNVNGAWRITTGRPDVVSAVLDDGIRWRSNDSAMRDLFAKVRLNPGEAPEPRPGTPPPYPEHPYDKNGDGVFNMRDYCSTLGPTPVCQDTRVSDRNGNGWIDPEDLILDPVLMNNTDDDGNGYVDDVAGWDFFQNDNNPFDDVGFGHGTGRAVESSAEAANGGQVGNCPSCTFIPVRVGDSFIVDANNFARGVIFAVDSGANIIQAALGAITTSSFGQAAVEYAYSKGTTVIAAMGDEQVYHHNVPQTYEHTIGVNAVRNRDDASFPQSYLYMSACTNYGSQVHVTIPTDSCSSGATGNAAGMAGLAISVAKNRIAQGRMTPYVRDNGSHAPYALSPNEIAQIFRAAADDIDLSTPRGGDPANNYALPPLFGLFASENYHTVEGWDLYSGYGRANARKMVAMISDTTLASPRIPPEADITSPKWFEIVSPTDNLEIRGRVAANRANSYDWVLEWAPGVQPPEWPDSDHWTTAASGIGETSAIDGALGSIDMADVAAAVGVSSGPPAGAAGEPEPDKFSFRVRVRVTDDFGNKGEYQKQFFVHEDADLLPGFPLRVGPGGESGGTFADLDGDGVDDLVIADSDGRVHAYRPDGTELPGWPVTSTPIPLDLGSAGFVSGGLTTTVHAAIAGGSVAVADLDRDGLLEVAMADAEGKLYVFQSDGSIRPGFPKETNRDYSGPTVRNADNRVHWAFAAQPTIADITGDGFPEILAGATDRHVYAWHADGSEVAGWPVLLRDPTKIASVDPVTHKVTYVVGANQRIGSKIIMPPSVGDLDGDGNPEVLAAVNEAYAEPPNTPIDTAGIPGLDPGNGRAYAIKATGLASPGVPTGSALHPAAFVTGWPVKVPMLRMGALPTVTTGSNGPLVAADVDGDGDDEVFVQSASGGPILFDGNGIGFYGRNADGKDLPLATSTPFGSASNSSDFASIGAMGGGSFSRLNGDDRPDPMAAGLGFGKALDIGFSGIQRPGDFHISAWDATAPNPNGGVNEGGAWLDGFPTVVNEYPFFSQPIAADIDGDGKREAVMATAGYDLRAVDSDGSVPEGWPKFTGGWVGASPAVGDWFGDGSQVITTITRRGLLFAWRTGGSVCDSDWPRYSHDPAGTGNYRTDATQPGPVSELTAVVSGDDVELRWRAPGDDGKCGTVFTYEVRASDTPLAEPSWDLGDPITDSVPVPGAPGTYQSFPLPPETYGRYVGIRSVDEAGNVSRVRQVFVAEPPAPEPAVISGTFTNGTWGAIAVFTADTGMLTAYYCCLANDSWSIPVPASSCPGGGYKILFIPAYEGQRYVWYDVSGNWTEATCVSSPSSGNDMNVGSPGLITGYVKDASDASDIDGAVVYAYRLDGVFAGWTRSGRDGTGRYRLQLDPAYSYKILLKGPPTHENVWSDGAPGFFEATAVATPGVANFSLRQAATITGQATRLGSGLPNTYVSAYTTCGCTSPQNTVTDALGNYSIKVVSTAASGWEYKIRFIPPSGATRWYADSAGFGGATNVAGPSSGIDQDLPP